MPPMSMHSIGQACAHWKQVSHFRAPYSSYRSWRRPRNLCGMLGLTSGYLIVAFGSKKRRRVRPMPLTRPRPGMKVIGRASSRMHDGDRRRGHEQVEQRRREEPFPGEPHQLVDPDTRQRATHPDEGEDEDVRLAEEPEETGDPIET